jgi:D-psicose/D-tagatose/L-ribulose 3-epimerase
VGNVEIGVCRPCADLEKTAEYGFDYLEPPAAEVAAMSQPRFDEFKAQVLASPIQCECFNIFAERNDLVTVGSQVHWDRLTEYVDHTLTRCQQLGGKIVVWGSARTRNVPPGFPRQVAWSQICQFLRLAGDIARRYQIIMAVEPLRKLESNIINTGAEALQLVHEVHHPNVKMIVDYYHLREENEDSQIIWKARREIVHFHFANPHGRLWPKSPAEDPEYGRFFALVKKIQFRGGISIEGHGTLGQDGAASLEFFRKELGARTFS